MDASYGSLSANNISVTVIEAGVYHVEADIENIHAAARSSATLNVVYQVVLDKLSLAANNGNSIDFDDDLYVAGGIEFYAPAGDVGINVNGNVNLIGLNITPLDYINAIGSVTLNSDITVDHIHSNEDVNLSGTKVVSVKALGDFYADSAASVQQLWVNGEVELNKVGGRFSFIDAIGKIDSEGSGSDGHGTFRSGETVEILGAQKIDLIEAVGSVDLSSWWGEAVEVRSMDLSANDSLDDCPSSTATITAESNASNSIVAMAPLEPYVNEKKAVDVWPLKSLANYVVEYDTAKSLIKVTVNNVEGFTDNSEHYIGNHSTTRRDYICSQVDGSGNCLSPATPLVPICMHSSINNNCISYDTSDQEFTLNPNETAPGIMWFDGDLHLLGGQGMTSYLATGDVTTRGAFKNSAVNFAGYASVCEGDVSHLAYDTVITDRYTDMYSAVYPKNLCDKVEFKYLPIPAGNIGIAAGGYNPAGDGSFTGGDVDLGANTIVQGAVLAGNFLSTRGDVEIKGLVLAANQGDKGAGDNSLGGKTVVDINTYGSTTYNPTLINPLMFFGNSICSDRQTIEIPCRH